MTRIQPMKIHPLLNNLNTAFLRRAIIGIALGLFIVTIIHIMGDSELTKQESNIITYDTAAIPLPVLESSDINQSTENEMTTEKDQENIIDEINTNSENYKNFARHQSKLNAIQANAIKNDTPRLSLVLSNVGQQQAQIKSIIDKLPKSVTISISPYARMHNIITNELKEYGFETWLDLATLELSLNQDWGDNGLSPSYNYQRNIELLSAQMNDKDNITGVILANNSLLTESPQLWADITQDLFADGFGILDNTSGIIKPALFFFDDKRAPYIKGDEELSKTLTRNMLIATLETIRKQTIDQKNMIVTIPYSTPATLDILSEWLNSLGDNGITLVPLSAQAKL
jgi:polysaccharide deacetylase 2 family uncharacterized protein YibQ